MPAIVLSQPGLNPISRQSQTMDFWSISTIWSRQYTAVKCSIFYSLFSIVRATICRHLFIQNRGQQIIHFVIRDHPLTALCNSFILFEHFWISLTCDAFPSTHLLQIKELSKESYRKDCLPVYTCPS